MSDKINKPNLNMNTCVGHKACEECQSSCKHCDPQPNYVKAEKIGVGVTRNNAWVCMDCCVPVLGEEFESMTLGLALERLDCYICGKDTIKKDLRYVHLFDFNLTK